MDKNFVITIGREFGSGGHEIGKRLAEVLQIAFYDKELIFEASKRSGISTELLERVDEKAPKLIDFALMGAYSNETLLSNNNFHLLQAKVLMNLAAERSCVIVGRCADFVLKNHSRCLNLFIHAPLEYRIQAVMRRSQVSNEEALATIEKKDKERSKYYNFYTDKAWGQSASYHLSIDSSLLGSEQTTNYILSFIRQVHAAHDEMPSSKAV